MSSDPNENLVWIRTQDGSPTLWNNDVGEPYRSVKGAFHESLIVFVKPAIEFAKENLEKNLNKIILCEFGLGAGTNWLFFESLARHYKIPVEYHAIERDPSAFHLSLPKWTSLKQSIQDNVEKHLGLKIQINVAELQQPKIYSSMEDCISAFKSSNDFCHLWFHDPFGSGVNPEGYSLETLKFCSQIFHPTHFLGLSYACNGAFQRILKDLGLTVNVAELNSPPLKKEALRFSRYAEETLRTSKNTQ